MTSEFNNIEAELMNKSRRGIALSDEDIRRAYVWHRENRRKLNRIFYLLLLPMAILLGIEYSSGATALFVLAWAVSLEHAYNIWIGWYAFAVFAVFLLPTIIMWRLVMKYHPTAQFYNARKRRST